MQTKTSSTSTPVIDSTKSTAFEAIKSPNSYLVEGLTLEEICGEYKLAIDKKIKDIYSQELLFKQKKMLSKIANYVWRAHREIGEFDDFFQHACVQAISAYDRFDINKNIKLSTWTYNNVAKNLISMCDESGTIKCPSGKRAFRAYFNGKYDNDLEKKRAFEEKYLKDGDNDTREKFQQQCEVIQAEVISYESYITNEEGKIIDREFTDVFRGEQSEIIDPIDWQNTVDEMKDKTHQIYILFFEDKYTVKEIIQLTGWKENEIKKEIRIIKTLFRKKFPELATDRKLIEKPIKENIEVPIIEDYLDIDKYVNKILNRIAELKEQKDVNWTKIEEKLAKLSIDEYKDNLPKEGMVVVKKKRGRPLGTKNITEKEISGLSLLNSKKRGRPVGSKNKLKI